MAVPSEQIEAHSSVIKGKLGPSITTERKKAVWDEITEKYI